MKNLFIAFLTLLLFVNCAEKNKKEAASVRSENIVQKVDEVAVNLKGAITNFKTIAVLDHHRMAAEAGVYTPPSIALIFSDPKTDIPLIQANQLTGLDLPFKVLCYAEPDTSDVKIAFTSAEFIQKRHDLETSLLLDYKSKMKNVIKSFPEEMVSKTNNSNVDEGFGIVQIKSDFDYTTTVKNLRNIVMSQSDTKWFADVDYQKEASDLGISIRPTILLLFGGPAPGGKAMMTSPKIGLDAFCQKLLVYEKENGEVWAAYNDIVAFAELYYQTSTKPQQMINKRLKMTFTKAVTRTQ